MSPASFLNSHDWGNGINIDKIVIKILNRKEGAG